MSWLFGRKKDQKEPSLEPTEEEQTSREDEGYVFVEKRPAPPVPPRVGQTATEFPTGDYISSISGYSSLSIHSSNNQGESTHYLNDVPFKLCKQLESSMKNDFEIDRLRIGEILSFIERIQTDSYNYNFSLEEGVIAEMNSSNGQ
ncbi:PREDICTED: uncharacterized protein LOC107193855 [Dufourea novaeangliae]|uniref:UMA domain-containing protein n=1 Tax=Dufourea novaeangliae TaxID=178035 RepID=A0A154P0U5_DUFNO|nr:PREDICTED: uncharacterized protein LOC107193855 [Dufourea novaeangliae]KZC05442.1 hypothetical protein WN55_06412 [Dufourea novaeangliae]